jgi:hypothetical protein
MSWRMALLGRAMPAGLRLKLLDELASVTAHGFGSPPLTWDGLSFDARLDRYARFTAQRAEALLAEQDAAAVDAAMMRLRSGAAELGARTRRRLGVKSEADALEALAVLYRQIGIDMDCSVPGEITVSRCLFAAYFTEPVCRVVGALDEGMAAGLTGGSRLDFIERLTAGGERCRACLRPEARAL